MRIEGSGGASYEADVDERGNLHVVSVVHSTLFEHSRMDGEAYSWASGTYNYDAADTILLVENTSASKFLHIYQIFLSGDTDTRAVVHLPAGNVTTAGTAITGLNLNTNSGKVAEANGVRDETGNTQGSIFWSGEIMAATDPYCIEVDGSIILTQNRSIGVDYVTDGGACDVTIIGYYLDPT